MGKAPRHLALLAAAVALCPRAWAQPAKSAEVLLRADFEDAEAGQLPLGWTPFSGAAGMSVTSERAHEGQRSLQIVDTSSERGVGLRSPRVPVHPGEYYSVEGWYWAEPGQSMSLYLEFWDAAGNRIADAVRSFGVSGARQWAKVSGTERAPEGAVAATALPYSHSENVASGFWDDITIIRGIPIMFDRTPQPPARVKHPCGLYDEDDIERARQNIERHEWARKLRDGFITYASFWMRRPDERIADWIPAGTPFRVCDCPNCGANWAVNPFVGLDEGRFKCRRCGTEYPNPNFPETGREVFINPLGQEEVNTFYQDAQGKKYRLSGHSRYRRLLRLDSVGYVGRMYALTGEIAYAEKVRKVLLRLAEVYPGYVPHDWDHVYLHYDNLQSGKLSGWKLQDATIMIELCLAYDLTCESGVYSDADKSLIEEGVFREAARLITSTSPRGACVNDGPFLMGAGAYIARLLGEHRYMAWALEPPHGFFGFIEENFWRDGHWEDGSPSYEFMALSDFHVLPEIAQGYSDPPDYTGPDRYDNLDLLTHPLLRKVYIASLHTLLPNGRLPAVNDSHFSATYPARFAEINYQWFPTERNLALLNFAYGGQAGATADEHALFRRPPDFDPNRVPPLDLAARSLVRPALGWAILRQGQKPVSTMLLLDYGLVRGHAHPDKLNWLLFARGRELVPDQGYLSARHHYQPWLQSTACHNVVLVEGRPQQLAAGELLSFTTGEVAQSITAQAPAAYPGQVDRYERTLVLMTPEPDPPYVLDVFRVSGGQHHIMAFHGDGQSFDATLNFSPCDAVPIADAAGAKWLGTPTEAPVSGPFAAWWGRDEDQPAWTRLTVLDPAAERAWHATAPGQRDYSQPWEERTMHVLFRRQPGPDAVFVSVVEAVVGQPALAAIERLRCSDPTVVAVRVERPRGTDYLFVGDRTSAAAEVTCDELPGLRFTGRLAVLTLVEGEVTFAQLVDGTSLRLGALSLTASGPMQGHIVALDDTADTFTVDVPLPAGEALRGTQLIVSGRTDGAYEIERVEAAPGGALVHLADEPILRVQAGDAFTLSSVVELRRLPDGSMARCGPGP